MQRSTLDDLEDSPEKRDRDIPLSKEEVAGPSKPSKGTSETNSKKSKKESKLNHSMRSDESLGAASKEAFSSSTRRTQSTTDGSDDPRRSAPTAGLHRTSSDHTHTPSINGGTLSYLPRDSRFSNSCSENLNQSTNLSEDGIPKAPQRTLSSKGEPGMFRPPQRMESGIGEASFLGGFTSEASESQHSKPKYVVPSMYQSSGMKDRAEESEENDIETPVHYVFRRKYSRDRSFSSNSRSQASQARDEKEKSVNLSTSRHSTSRHSSRHSSQELSRRMRRGSMRSMMSSARRDSMTSIKSTTPMNMVILADNHEDCPSDLDNYSVDSSSRPSGNRPSLIMAPIEKPHSPEQTPEDRIFRIANWLAHDIIGHSADMNEMKSYAQRFLDEGFHSVEMIQQTCTVGDLSPWMKRAHRRLFLARSQRSDRQLRKTQISRISDWLSNEVIGFGVDRVTMDSYAERFMDEGFHSIEMIQELCTEDDLVGWKRAHRRMLVTKGGLKSVQ